MKIKIYGWSIRLNTAVPGPVDRDGPGAGRHVPSDMKGPPRIIALFADRTATPRPTPR